MKWLVFETDNLIVIIPNKDKRPHGKKLSESRYDIDTMVCECNPTVEVGELQETIKDFFFEVSYEKPIVTHNEFGILKK
jgi:hypothetical protein